MRPRLVVVLLLVVFSSGVRLTPVGAQAGPPNIAGTWVLQYMGSQEPIKMTFVFKQEGEKLSGTFSGVGPTPPCKVTGTVKGRKAVFGWEQEGNRGTTFIVAFKGTVESATRMTGTVGPPFCRDCSWTATKKK